jgi:hypothetical protein
MYRIPLVCQALLGAALVLPLAPVAPAAPAPVRGKPVDVVLCLDVSTSMQGLIDSAKLKLWDIVNDLGKAKPAPDLRVALYSYGHSTYDPTAGWVRKEADLTTDLDTVYQKLTSLTINGGEEYVARVCRDALDQQKWSEDKDAYKVIFVCGNEPASQDPLVKLPTVADLAKKKGVVVNTIFCGPSASGDAQDWKEFAKLAAGRFASIDQDHGTVAIVTPHDKELTELSTKLNTTYVVYGKDGQAACENQTRQDNNAVKAGAPTAAARSVSKASAVYRCSTWDLVDRCKDDPKFDIKKVPVAELCDEMKKLTPEQREKYVKDKMAEREVLQKKVAEVNARREAFIKAELKKNPSAADKAFDEAVRVTIREQAASKGIAIPSDK